MGPDANSRGAWWIGTDESCRMNEKLDEVATHTHILEEVRALHQKGLSVKHKEQLHQRSGFARQRFDSLPVVHEGFTSSGMPLSSSWILPVALRG